MGKKQRRKKAPTGIQTRDLLVKKKLSFPLLYGDLHVNRSQECVYTPIFMTNVYGSVHQVFVLFLDIINIRISTEL
jgi:hypothetical protein